MTKGRPRRIFGQSKRAQPPQSVLATKLQQATAFHQNGQLAQAEIAYREILSQVPDHCEALHLVGVLECQKGHYETGAKFIARAIKADRTQPVLHYNLGLALHHLKRPREALASFDRAVALKPDYVQAFNNRGVALQNLKRLEEALVSFDRALALKPDHVEALTNRGVALHGLGRPEEALLSFDRALAIIPHHAEALNNRGKALQDLKRPEEALVNFERALAVKPDFAAAHWNESLCRLLIGDFERGLPNFEWRWQTEELETLKRDLQAPQWLGRESLADKTILLHAEQGFGDTIQFCRYAKLVAARGATVLLEVQRELKSLLVGLEGVAQVLARGEPLPSFDYHCPLLSLPLALSTRLNTIPADIPYLRSDPNRVERWQAMFNASTGTRVGLAWAGSIGHTNDSNRSIPLAEFAGLVSGQARFFSLQKEVRRADKVVLDTRQDICHLGDQMKDFADTAALIELMDLVITVDTSVAHLAGAMGKPVWILLPFAPDWRWLLDRDTSPWYPAAKLFRQSARGDWNSVIERAASELRKL